MTTFDINTFDKVQTSILLKSYRHAARKSDYVTLGMTGAVLAKRGYTYAALDAILAPNK